MIPAAAVPVSPAAKTAATRYTVIAKLAHWAQQRGK
jgi:hypothetical protein